MREPTANLIPVHRHDPATFGADIGLIDSDVQAFNSAALQTIMQTAETDAPATVMAEPAEARDLDVVRASIDRFVPAARRPIAEYTLFGNSFRVALWQDTDGRIASVRIGLGPDGMTFGAGRQKRTAPVLMRFIRSDPSERIARLPVGLRFSRGVPITQYMRRALYDLFMARDELETMRQSALHYLGSVAYQKSADSVRQECGEELMIRMSSADVWERFLVQPEI